MNTKRKGISAAAWFAGQSFHQHAPVAVRCEICDGGLNVFESRACAPCKAALAAEIAEINATPPGEIKEAFAKSEGSR